MLPDHVDYVRIAQYAPRPHRDEPGSGGAGHLTARGAPESADEDVYVEHSVAEALVSWPTTAATRQGRSRRMILWRKVMSDLTCPPPGASDRSVGAPRRSMARMRKVTIRLDGWAMLFRTCGQSVGGGHDEALRRRPQLDLEPELRNPRFNLLQVLVRKPLRMPSHRLPRGARRPRLLVNLPLFSRCSSNSSRAALPLAAIPEQPQVQLHPPSRIRPLPRSKLH